MIASLTGTVSHKDLNYAVLDVNGVGYKVFAPAGFLADALVGQTLFAHIHHVVKEDSQELYGFANRNELRLFELLISVSGIGPKSALSILNATTPESLKQAVETEDTSHLTKVSGIGRKIAEKIVIELRDKLDWFEALPFASNDIDAIEALRSLGYTQKESQEALKKVPRDLAGTGEKVKYALRLLSN